MIEVDQHFRSLKSGRTYAVASIDFDNRRAALVDREDANSQHWPISFATLSDPDLYQEVE